MKSPSEIAEHVLVKYWGAEIPVLPEAIARRLGVEVIPDDALAEDELSGKFEYEDGHPVIRFNPQEPKVRQRFTIAHEMGHFLLDHQGVFRDPTRNFSLSNYDPREVAANKVAAEILMPKTAIKKLIVDKGMVNVTRLARQFDVSEVAMKYRLTNLGWTS